MNKESDTIMKYFIDLEATQFSNEIISIGCVREDGETFYSLVNVAKNKMTNFITELTGITKEDVEKAPNSDEVFSKFYDWISQDETKAIFYCYGNADLGFIRKNLNKAESVKAQMALSLITLHLVDYAKNVVKHFGLVKSIALKKVLAYYRKEENIKQNHNSLEDAFFLKEIYDYITEEGGTVDCPFPGYDTFDEAPVPKELNSSLKIKKLQITTDKIMSNKMNYDIVITSNKNGGKILQRFTSKEEAVNFTISHMKNDQKEKVQIKNVISKIVKANTHNTQYCGYWWKIIEKGAYTD